MRADDVDADWLTRSLRAPLGTDAAVASCTATSIGTGQVGENVRFELEWDRADPTLPATVVGKFPSASEISRAAAVQMNTYVKEIGFYRHLDAQVEIRTPQVYWLEWEPSTHDFVILMEDIRPATQGDQLRGCTVEQAMLAIDQAVGLHAPTWGRTAEWDDHEWLVHGDADERRTVMAQLLAMLTPGFVERFAERLAPDVLAIAERLAARYSDWHMAVVAWTDQHAPCVVHGDYRLDNMLFGEPPSSPGLTVVDWQTVSIGAGPVDVAYFCGAGLLPDLRLEAERELVVRYATGLRAAGVDLTDEAAWDGYVLGSASGYIMAVLASQVVERTDRGDEMFAVMAERHAAQMRAVGLLDRLGIT